MNGDANEVVEEVKVTPEPAALKQVVSLHICIYLLDAGSVKRQDLVESFLFRSEIQTRPIWIQWVWLFSVSNQHPWHHLAVLRVRVGFSRRKDGRVMGADVVTCVCVGGELITS